MFDHVKFGVSNFAMSKAFFLKALEPLGVTVVTDWPPDGVELSQPNGVASLCLYQTAETPAPLHLAFIAESREQVQSFYRAALDAGGKDNGAPGLRPQYSGRYYAAFVIGPDGHNIEAVCHEPEAWVGEWADGTDPGLDDHDADGDPGSLRPTTFDVQRWPCFARMPPNRCSGR